MTKSVKYIGTTSRWPELAVTGKQSTWEPGKIEERSDTEAAQLLGTGLFADQSALQLPDSKVAAISAVVSGDGAFFSATGGGSGLVADGVVAPWAVVASRPMTHSMLGGFGVLAQFFRSALSGGRPYVIDHKGRFIRTLYGECLFHGARRVYNLLSFASNLTNAVWTATSGGTIAPVYDSNVPGKAGGQTMFLFTKAAVAGSVFRRATGVVYPAKPHVASADFLVPAGVTSVELRVHIAGGATLATKVATGLASGQRYRMALGCTPDGTSAYVVGITPHGYGSAAAGSLYLERFQIEDDLDGLGIPSEFVDNGGNPASRYWHGSGVDGVKCFDTLNGNTVDSNGIVTEATGAAITGIMGVMTFPSATQQILDNSLASGWTATNCTLTDGHTGPDGEATAIKINEGSTASVAHHIQRTLTGVGAIAAAAAYNGETWYPFIAVVKKGASGAPWMRLHLTDTNGSGWSAYFNIDTASAGTVENGHLHVYPLPNNPTWVLVIWQVRVRNGSGSTDPLVRISMVNGNATPTFTGTNRENLVWLPCLYTSTSTSAPASQRPTYVPPTLTDAAASTVPNQSLAFSVDGALGRTDFGVASTYYPFFAIEDGDRQQYTGTTYLRTAAPGETRGSTTLNLDMQRTGISIRPPLSGGAGNCKFAMDFYNGDPNPVFFWQPGHAYSVGDQVIPLDTQPNNDNGRKVFTCVQAGTSGGGEPTWNTTYTAAPDTTSNLTTDNTVRWQVNEPNGINGTWEPYSGCELLADQGFLGRYRVAWYVRHDSYGMYVNGVLGTRQTGPDPRFPAKGFTLDYDPKTLYLGGLGSNSGQYPEAVPAGQEHAVGPVHTAIHRDVVIWHTAPTQDAVALASA